MKRALLAVLGALATLAFAVPASAQSTVVIHAIETGTSTTSPANGTLFVYDTNIAEHHTRQVEYDQHDGYSKTENLVSKSRPLGVVLKEEDIENACHASSTDGSVNPVGGYDIGCGGVLSSHPVTLPLGGDLIGRFCRVPQPPYTLHCPAMPPIHVNENATGTGQYLQVGNKDHGAMLEVDYYVNVAGVNSEVDVILPPGVLVTRIVLLPQTGSPSAVLVLN